MKKGISISLALIIIGGLIFAGIFASYDFDFTKLEGGATVEKTYELNESFSDINFSVTTGDITVVKSLDGKVKAVTRESEKIIYTVKVVNDTLEIKREDTRRFWEKLFSPSTPVTLYLPEGDYGKIMVDATTSDIALTGGFSFIGADIDVTTGDIAINNVCFGEANVKTTTGDISISEVSVNGSIGVKLGSGEITGTKLAIGGDFGIKLTTGDVSLSNVDCNRGGLNIEGTTGDVEMASCLFNKISLQKTTGDVELEHCDAADIYIKTTTGDVEGTLLTGKTFEVSATTGEVRVPSDFSDGGVCRIKTTTGDIKITVVE